MSKTGAWIMLVFGLGVVVAAGLAVLGFGSFFPALFAVVGLVLAFQGGRTLMAASVFEVAELVVRSPVPLGGTATLTLELVPKKPLTLVPGDCVAVWKTVERAEYSAGTRSRTYRNTVCEVKVPLELPTGLTHPLQQHLTVTVPADAPPSWSGSSNFITSTVRVTVGIAAWPDLHLEREITVLPEVADV